MNRSTGLQLLAAGFVTLPLVACDDSATRPADGISRSDAVRVVVAPLRIDSARTRLEAVGTSRAIRSVEVHPATSGEVIAVHFQPGQRVAAGDVLVELERREEELAVALATVKLEDAERLYDRYRRSAESGAVLPTTIDAARTAAESARIELERARVNLDYRTIRAPFAGFVGISDVDSGDRVNPDTIVTTLDDRSALLVSFEAPEALHGEIEVGGDVAISTWNSRDAAAFGEIADIGSRIDPLTRTFVVRARVDNSSDKLRPGMSFRIAMDVRGSAYPVIAETAVQWGADGAYVWSVVDGAARRVPVSVVQRKQGSVLIDTDLGAGELVIVEGIQRMRPGVDVSYDAPSLAASDRRDRGADPEAD